MITRDQIEEFEQKKLYNARMLEDLVGRYQRDPQGFMAETIAMIAMLDARGGSQLIVNMLAFAGSTVCLEVAQRELNKQTAAESN